MKTSVKISRGIESLFGTRDENIRLLETGLNVKTQLLDDSLEIEGERSRRGPRREHPRGLRRAGQGRPGLLQRRPEQLPSRGHRGPGRHSARPGRQRQAAQLRQEAGGAQVLQPAPLRGSDRAPRPGDRHRAGGHREDLPGGRHGHLRAAEQAGQPHHPDPPGGGGRRETGLPAGHAAGEGGPVPAAALRRALRHAGGGQGGEAAGAVRDRSGAAGLHARPHAERQLHHHGRGPELARPNR